MIVWIASYPKSGNTWVRSILTSLFFSKDGSIDFEHLDACPKYPSPEHLEEFTKDFYNYDEMAKYWVPSQEKLNRSQNKINFLKTHHLLCAWKNYVFTNPKNTLGTIYIVRDPRNVFTSVKNHFSFTDEEALNMMLDKNWSLTNGIKTMLSSWGLHYFSWTKNNKSVLLIKYEDMMNDLRKEIYKILNYLSKFNINVNFSEEKINNCIKTSNFSNFQDMEKKGLFDEQIVGDDKKKKTFFKLGKKNDFRKLLNEKIKYRLEKEFKKEMKELNYL